MAASCCVNLLHYFPFISCFVLSCSNEREHLIKCASTTLSSKLVASERQYFAEMCVNAVSMLNRDATNLKNIGIKKVSGGSLMARLELDLLL